MVPAAWPWYILVSSSLGSPLSCGPGSTRRRCAGSCRRLETGRTQRSRSDLFMGCCQVTWTSGLMPGHWVRDETWVYPPTMDSVSVMMGAAEPAHISPPFGSHKSTSIEREVECYPVLVGSCRRLKSDHLVILPPAIPFEHLGRLHDDVGMHQYAGNPVGPESGHCCHIPVVADHPSKHFLYYLNQT